MNESLTALAGWYHLLLAYAIVLGLEGPLLLVLALVKRRPWYQCLLMLLPVAGFCWSMQAARIIKLTYDTWQGYYNFQLVAYGPQYLERSLNGLPSAANSVQPLIWQAGALTGLLLILGWGLFIHWYAPKRQPAPTSIATPSATPSATIAQIEDGTLEITFEPIDYTT